MNYCANCRKEIERSESAAGGWRHSERGQVRCLLDAAPLDETLRKLQEWMNEPSALFERFKRETDN